VDQIVKKWPGNMIDRHADKEWSDWGDAREAWSGWGVEERREGWSGWGNGRERGVVGVAGEKRG
jgi:hypothetical protein